MMTPGALKSNGVRSKKKKGRKIMYFSTCSGYACCRCPRYFCLTSVKGVEGKRREAGEGGEGEGGEGFRCCFSMLSICFSNL